MIERVKEILKYSFKEINSSEKIIEFLEIYSILYLKSKKPTTCESCHLRYYNELRVNGIKKAEQMGNTKKTCVASWKGNRFSSKAQRHYNSNFITDEIAMEALESGSLSESDFKVLPEGYGAELTKDETPVETKDETPVETKDETPVETKDETPVEHSKEVKACLLDFNSLLEKGESKTKIVDNNAGAIIDGKKVTKKYLGELVEISRDLTEDEMLSFIDESDK